MTPFLAEMIGTAILIVLGDGVVANVVLKQTKGEGSGWIVITFGWGMAVFVAVLCVSSYSGAHINPAVTIGLAAVGKFAWSEVPAYIVAQMIGAALGVFLVWVQYKPHFDNTDDSDTILSVFCTGPAIRNTFSNLMTEIIGTIILVMAVLYHADPDVGLGALDALPIGLVVLAIGLSLGGTTGYAINPARDLAPRIVHAILPLRHKRDSDWGYAWIPIVGPVIGSILAAVMYLALH